MDRCRALIVDGDRAFVDRLRRSLAAIGFEADGARNGEAALDYLRQRRPAIVVLGVERTEDVSLAAEIRRIVDDVPLLLVCSESGGAELPCETELATATVAGRPRAELDEAAILAELDRSLRLGLDRSELERLAASAASIAGWAGERTPPDLAAAFERWRGRLDEAAESHRATIREGSARHVAELAAIESACRAELEDLRRQLEGERKRRFDDEIRVVEERHRETLQELRADHARLLEQRSEAQRRDSDREVELAATRHRQELQTEREAHRLEVESLRELRSESESRQRESVQRLEKLTATLAATRAELESEREAHRAARTELRELGGAIEHREREGVEELERVTAALQHDLTRENGRRLSELEQAENEHRGAVAEIESRYREQVELMRRLHEEEVEQLQARTTRDRERLEREHVSALKVVAAEQRETTDRLLEQREAEWRAKLERERGEHARILAAERAEFRIVFDALRDRRDEAGSVPAVTARPTAVPQPTASGSRDDPMQATLLGVVEQLESSLVPEPLGEPDPPGDDPYPGDTTDDRRRV